MPYTKTVWDETVGVTPARLNNLETQYDKAVADSLPRSGGDISGNLTIANSQVVTAANIGAYAPSPANYDDRTANVTITAGSGRQFPTIAAALASLKKVNAGQRTIEVASGHVEPAGITIRDFYGAQIVIAPQGSNYSINGTVTVMSNGAKINLQSTVITGNGFFDCQNNLSVFMNNCTNNSSNSYGMWGLGGGFYNINSCQFSNHLSRGIHAGTGTIMYLSGVTGTGNGTGISSDGAIVMKDTTSTITGTTPVSKSSGGQVF